MTIDAQILANLLTSLVALVTVWMAVETRRMARTAQDALLLESRPYLSFDGLQIERAVIQTIASPEGDPSLRVSIRLRNPGRVRVVYEVQQMLLELEGDPAPAAIFETTGGVLHPDEQNLYYYSWVLADRGRALWQNGAVDFRVAYWATPGRKETLAAKVLFIIKGTDPLNWDWHYKHGPTYAEESV